MQSGEHAGHIALNAMEAMQKAPTTFGKKSDQKLRPLEKNNFFLEINCIASPLLKNSVYFKNNTYHLFIDETTSVFFVATGYSTVSEYYALEFRTN